MSDPLGGDPANGRYKAFLFVGIAYFLTAVLAPLAILLAKGAAFTRYTSGGMWWSLLGGIVGAIGAFSVLLAFGAKGRPPEVMAIVFAGAPVINAVVSIAMHPPSGGLSAIKPQFLLGAVLALCGGALVTLYKPAPAPPPKPAAAQAAPAVPAPGNPPATK
jgi:hypothetical protein